jgi:murein DD-endopeptidase MepM/ murein hydrolase activator NlpD
LVEDGFLMKSSSLTQQGARRAYAEGLLHTVREGETVATIAARYGIAADTIRWANDLEHAASPKPGDTLIILPVDGVLHTVARGQTLSRIAELYDVSVDTISEQNDIRGGFILAGQELIIPGAAPIVAAPLPPPAQVAVVPGAQAPPRQEAPPAARRPAPPSPGRPSTETATPSGGILQMPCENCTYTQYYHAGHYAVDLQTRGGGPIFASEAGTVVRAETGWNGGYGNVIEVDHGNGLVTLYAHNKELYVAVGDRVARGQQIAWMGNSGRVYGKTGIHIHYEVRVHGVKKNPVLYLK